MQAKGPLWHSKDELSICLKRATRTPPGHSTSTRRLVRQRRCVLVCVCVLMCLVHFSFCFCWISPKSQLVFKSTLVFGLARWLLSKGLEKTIKRHWTILYKIRFLGNQSHSDVIFSIRKYLSIACAHATSVDDARRHFPHSSLSHFGCGKVVSNGAF